MFIFSGQKGEFYIFSTAKDVHIFWRGRDIYIREGWPLRTVETEANGDSRSTYEWGPSLVGSLDSSTRDFCPAFLS
jgi:hypothetical protein